MLNMYYLIISCTLIPLPQLRSVNYQGHHMLHICTDLYIFLKNIYGAKKFKNGDRDIKISEQQTYGPERRTELRLSIF
jgi:hypothetical protein